MGEESICLVKTVLIKNFLNVPYSWCEMDRISLYELMKLEKNKTKKEKNSHVRSILYFKVSNTDIRRSFFTFSTATNGIMENHKKNSAINHRNYLDRENRHQIGMMTVYTGQDYHRI